MKKKILGIFVMTLLIAAVIPTQGNTVNNSKGIKETTDYSYLYQNDAIMPPDIKDLSMNQGPEPGYYDLSEYMIGTIALGVIFLESDGSIDPSTEDWTQAEKDAAMGSLGVGGGQLQWSSWFSNENLFFHTYFVYGEINTVQISYEPIIHPSAITDDTYEKLYVAEAMGKLGYTTGDWMQRVRDYSNYLRDTTETIPGYYGTNWAFVVFLVDNSNDADLLFSDGYHAYAYLGGPFTVCPHYRPGGPPGPTLKEVFAHEEGHIFYATDEYNGQTDYSGYLNAADVEGSGCIMDNLALCVSSGTKLQVGWKDADADGRADILDTYPETSLTPYTPDPTSDPTPTYTGSATVQPLTNNNPNGPGNDVTLNTIANVHYRVDGGMWLDTTPDDGDWYDAVESYSFTTPPLSAGTHTIETKAFNSVGNEDQTPASDTLTIIAGNPPTAPTIAGPSSGDVGTSYTYTFTSTDPDGDQVSYYIDWDDGTTPVWSTFKPSGATYSTSHTWTSKGTYAIQAKAKDILGAESGLSTLSVTMPRNRATQRSFLQFLEQYPILYQLLLRFLQL